MASGDFGAVLDSKTFLQYEGQPPTLRKRNANVALLVSQGPAFLQVCLRSIAIDDAGLIDATPINLIGISNGTARDMGLLHWLDNVFVAYVNDHTAKGMLYTIACDDDGTITEPPLDSLVIGQASNIQRRSNLTKPHDGILLTAVANPYPNVFLQTVTITDAGIMPPAVTDSMNLPYGNRVQIVRQGAGDRIIDLLSVMAEYWIYSLTCTDAGDLPGSVTDYWGPLPSSTDWNSLCKVSDSVFAVLSQDASLSVYLRTFSINPDGTINKTWIDEELVDTVGPSQLHIMEMEQGYFVLAYTFTGPKWRLKTYFIAPDGTIQDGGIDFLDRSTGVRGSPWLEHLNGNIWTFTNEDSLGVIRVDTIEIQTPTAGNTHNELVFGIGP